MLYGMIIYIRCNMSNLRIEKINSLIQKKLSEIINQEYVETLGFVSINFVYATKDLEYVKVFVSFAKNSEESFKKLEKMRSDIQKKFGHSIKLRKTPKVQFVLDNDKEEIEKVEKILEKLSKEHEN